MYVETVPNRNSRPAVLLREGWREGERVRKRTLANLTDWSAEKVDSLRRVLKGQRLVSPSLPLRAAIGWGFVAISPIFVHNLLMCRRRG